MNENVLIRKVKSRQARVAVIGLGYVGLPLVRIFLEKGFTVTGLDIDEKKVKLLNRGKSYIRHVTGEELAPFVKRKQFRATADFGELGEADAVLICVPTPLDAHKNPDLSYVLRTTDAVAEHLRKGQVIVLESTTYPGTTENRVRPVLEAGGGRAGEDFFLGYSPERESPGNKEFTAATIPKIVSGVTPACRRVVKALYDQVVVRTVPVSSPQVAEAAKLLENIFRSVNIALVNEMKMVLERMGIDVWEVIQAASTKPFGFMPFYPGPGYGGHCIPVDPFYMAWRAKEVDYPTKFIELAGEINTLMPYYVVSKTVDALNRRGRSIRGARILVLGLAYKEDIDDQRESPALKIISLFRKKGAKVFYNDPHVPRASGYRDYPDLVMESVPLTGRGLKSFDAVVIATAHSAYDFDWIVEKARLVIDTRNAVKRKRRNVVKA